MSLLRAFSLITSILGENNLEKDNDNDKKFNLFHLLLILKEIHLTYLQLNAILIAVSCLSPVRTQTTIPASRNLAIASGTPS